MIGGLLATAGRLFIGGKFHWKTALTAFSLFQLLKPKPRMNPGFQQMMMYQQMMANPYAMNPMMMRGY